MKKLLILATLVLSSNLFAAPTDVAISVPYPTHQEAYFGTIRRVEVKLRNDLVAKAAKVCGSKENIAIISDVEANFSFGSIMMDTEDKFEGSYPLAAATARVSCYK